LRLIQHNLKVEVIIANVATSMCFQWLHVVVTLNMRPDTKLGLDEWENLSRRLMDAHENTNKKITKHEDVWDMLVHQEDQMSLVVRVARPFLRFG
jgi:hypothetical protein